MSESWLHSLPRRTLKGHRFWRCIEKEFRHTVLESGPNFHAAGRYNAKGEFSALYLSGTEELAGLEKTQGRDWSEPLENVPLLFNADVEVPDLTVESAQELVKTETGMGPGELAAPGQMAHARTRPLGRLAFRAGLPGLVVPSAYPAPKGRENWWNLVLFPANIVGAWLAGP